MAKNPTDRYPTAQALQQALARISTSPDTATREPDDVTTQPEPLPAPTLEAPASPEPTGSETVVRPATVRPDAAPAPPSPRPDVPPADDAAPESDRAETVIRPSDERPRIPGSSDDDAPTAPRRLGVRIALVAGVAVLLLAALVAVVTIINPGSGKTAGTAEQGSAKVVDNLTVEPSLTPTNLQVTGAAGQPWTLTWTNNAGANAQFVVQYRAADVKTWTVGGTANSASFTGPARAAGEKLCFGVTAVISRTTQSETATICSP